MERFSGGTKVLMILALIGAANWGLIGFLNFNLLGAVFGGGHEMTMTIASRVVYAIVGLCGVAAAITIPWTAKFVRPERVSPNRAEVRP